MKKVGVYSITGEKVEEISLPSVFETPYRPDVIKRAVLACLTARIQPHGTDPMAGKRTTAESWGPGRGVARVPRVKGRGYHAAQRAAFIPMAVGGRAAHPPKVEKKIKERINKKERKLAIRSAIAATGIKEIVEKRGHVIEKIPELPLIVEDEVQKLKTAKEVWEFLEKIGASLDIERVKKGRKIRAGKGKMRGRKYKTPKGPLIVIANDEGIFKAASNYPGVDIVNVKNLNAEVLAPGTHPGRLVIWTKSAIEKLSNGLFQ
ncbi:MAG: 50S ribosomal protein L4 [Candidatus Odinarchaeia archaeon]